MTKLSNYLGKSFVASEVPADERDGNFELLPDGDYAIVLSEAEVKETSKGGQMLKLTHDVTGPTHAGRKLWDNINIVNASEKAQMIGHQTLAKIATACGIDVLDDTDKLIGKRLIAVVKTEPAKGDWPAKNVVKNYKPINGAATVAAKDADGSSPSSSETKKPWKK